MSDARGDVGGTLLPLNAAKVPQLLKVEGDRLRWGWHDPDAPDQEPDDADSAGALQAFVRIADPAGVLRFARRFGVLMLCEHGVPAMHNLDPFPAGTSEARGCRPCGWPFDCWEPLDRWLHFVGQARARLSVAAALHRGVKPEPSDWETIYEDAPVVFVPDSLETMKSYFPRHINAWFRLGAVAPELDWPAPDGMEPLLRMRGGTFGVIAMQLAAACARANTIAQCDGCERPYLREGRKPQTGRRNFCPDCGERKASKLRKRDWRNRKPTTKRARDHGKARKR